ncbi:uncharacterized protein Dwil_GK28018 [Drosophila willistoni]|uniref:J domain-containing protein n=1 Tax=Drosophila willistoni TaxID=7260 RepID=A0A0Q9WW62_DROWI|nr:uncharacterized protein LOC124461985 [Drosophila willistoni]KRG00351.1 uncharacterized protein Dwil_GK28018 [Drosophila willistoni]
MQHLCSARCLAFYSASAAYMRHGRRYKENFYDVLKIPPNSNNQEIKRAFIQLSKNSEEFVRICDAYRVLIRNKESLRSQYDSRIRMDSPAVDTSYSLVNGHKHWQQYQAAIRKKPYLYRSIYFWNWKTGFY